MQLTKLSIKKHAVSYLKTEPNVSNKQEGLIDNLEFHTINQSFIWTKLLFVSNLIMALLFFVVAGMSMQVLSDSMFSLLELIIASIYIWFNFELRKQNRKAMQIYIIWLVGMSTICFLAYWTFIMLPILSLIQIIILIAHKNTRALFLYSYSVTSV